MGEKMTNTKMTRMPYGHLKYVLGKAICDFTDATGVHLPWNLNKVSEWKGIQGINEETDQHPYKEVQKIVHSCKQLAGWLLAAVTTHPMQE